MRKVERLRRYAENGGRDAIDVREVGEIVYMFFLEELSGIGNLQYWGILGICDGFMEFLRAHIVATLAMIPRSKLFAFFFSALKCCL